MVSERVLGILTYDSQWIDEDTKNGLLNLNLKASISWFIK